MGLRGGIRETKSKKVVAGVKAGATHRVTDVHGILQAADANRGKVRRQRRVEKGLQTGTHTEFVAELYWEQLVAGRYFLHEHPSFASSWALLCIKQLMFIPGAETA